MGEDASRRSEWADSCASWEACGLSGEEFDEKINWIGERRQLEFGCRYFFSLAARLYRHAREDHLVSGAAFFHTVIGVERALRDYYCDRDEVFSVLFPMAVEDGVVTDDVFGEVRELSRDLRKSAERTTTSHSDWLASAIPKLRNAYFHGVPLLSWEFLFIAVQLREVADVLASARSRNEVDPTP